MRAALFYCPKKLIYSDNNSDADLELFRDANLNNVLDQGEFIINAFDQSQGETKRLKLAGRR